MSKAILKTKRGTTVVVKPGDDDNVMVYLPKLPKKLPKGVPSGWVLVHNTVRPTRRLGSRGFRA